MVEYIDIQVPGYNDKDANIYTLRNSQLVMITEHSDKMLTPGKITFINASTGSGKTFIGADLALICANNNKDDKIVAHIISPNIGLSIQTRNAYNLYDGFIENFETIIIDDKLNKNHKKLFEMIDDIHENDKHCCLFWPKPSHNNNELTTTAELLKKTIEDYNYKPHVCILDEVHEMLTHLTGGLNPSLYNNSEWVKKHDKIRKLKPRNKINLFDIIRDKRVPIICKSATSNNAICSKLHSVGYKSEDILIINSKPFRCSAKKLTIQSMDTRDYDELRKIFDEYVFNDDNTFISVIASSRSDAYLFLRKMGVYERGIVYGEYTANCKDIDVLNRAKVVISCNLLGTGIDTALLCDNSDRKISLNIILRPFDDKQSNALANNKEHELNVDFPAKLVQSVSRQREGGLCIIDKYFGDISLFDIQMKIYNSIKNGYDTCFKIAGEALAKPIERYNQMHLVGLIQNIRIREKELPTVVKYISILEDNTERDIKEEYANSTLCNGKKIFDSAFWIKAISEMWDSFIDD